MSLPARGPARATGSVSAGACSLGLLLAVAAAWLSLRAASAQPSRPDPPRSPVIHYQPDTQGCRPEAIEAGFRRQLQPFADQSEAVLAQLRALQAELTSGSIRRCREKGLLSAEDAAALQTRLGLTATQPAQTQQPQQPQRP